MKTASGKLNHINCSRRCGYGYDQRVESFCEKGMLLSYNTQPTSLVKYSSDGTGSKGPLHEFFIERYQDAYRDQLGAFVDGLLAGTPVYPSFEDGLAAQALVEAAQEALVTGLPVKLT
jgi:myo-inositol 2-dehydrogenase/D-chiro-inositol 1-dehydrogenase